ncbi:hypothetical protein ACFO0N_06450 [Halobium salinum]|uniref:Molybdopterin cofactor biosynthesis MoaD-related C-terminal domain-containing protein n=1 Tax=Halobium salinum TaxID=1364940 RepID=A0ABD5PAW0_9EURY|nr:hypothetical protein [Halobium salinum]
MIGDDVGEGSRREKSYRGISQRLAAHYLGNLGGEAVSEGDEGTVDAVEGDGWSADLSSEKVEVGPSVTLTEVTVVFAGDPETLDELVKKFSQKAMRAGG